jgi:hypothetical protein
MRRGALQPFEFRAVQSNGNATCRLIGGITAERSASYGERGASRRESGIEQERRPPQVARESRTRGACGGEARPITRNDCSRFFSEEPLTRRKGQVETPAVSHRQERLCHRLLRQECQCHRLLRISGMAWATGQPPMPASATPGPNRPAPSLLGMSRRHVFGVIGRRTRNSRTPVPLLKSA